MKKIKYLGILLLALVLVGCGTKKYTEYTEINYQQLQQKLENKDSFAIVIGSDTCSACKEYHKTMVNVIKDKRVEIFYLDLNETTEEEYAKIYSSYVITSTPTTIFFVEGKEKTTYDRIIGAGSYGDVVKSLKKYGFIGD